MKDYQLTSLLLRDIYILHWHVDVWLNLPELNCYFPAVYGLIQTGLEFSKSMEQSTMMT